ncbi:MAG TPA: hypothetical protein VM305_02605 [Candidatus Limnocylindrales bacterium]|nr:hypothetical protein [Candidatus Limnocylindrales bacterium]
MRWAWSFLTHGRGSRPITGKPLLPEIEEPLEELAGQPLAVDRPDQPPSQVAE